MSGSRIAWRRVSRGLLFIGFGAFGLMGTQGLLHRGFWLDALAFWPVILIALGARLVFARGRARWRSFVILERGVGEVARVAARDGAQHDGGVLDARR